MLLVGMRSTPCDKPVTSINAKVLPAERKFAALFEASAGIVHRGGAPDFLCELEGAVIGVEIKRGEDKISPSQSRMFAALERGGIPVFVWDPRMPSALVPWRRYMGIGHSAREREIAEREYADPRLDRIAIIRLGF